MKKKMDLEAYLGIFIIISSLIFYAYTANTIDTIQEQAALYSANVQADIADMP